MKVCENFSALSLLVVVIGSPTFLVYRIVGRFNFKQNGR
jgi:hypothetical protein